jgi:hypothetical protein
MTLQEIKDAVEAGKTVCVGNTSYVVIKDSIDQWLIHYLGNDYYIGLTHRDGVTLNAKEQDFFIAKGESK